MQYRPGKSPGHFIIANRPKEEKINMCPGSHFYGHYYGQVKRALDRTRQLESFVFPLFSVLVGNRYVFHVGAEYRFLPNLRYHVQSFLKDVNVLGAIAFIYGGSFAIMK